MSYDVLFNCPYCTKDSIGNHEHNCPMTIISQKNNFLKYVNTYISDSTYQNKELELLKRLYSVINKLDLAYLNLAEHKKYLSGEEYDEINDVIADVQEYLEQI